MALYSSDFGENWHIATLEPPAKGVMLSQFNIPPSTYLSGYQYAHGLTWPLFSDYSVEPGPWWSTDDHGRSWRTTIPQLRFGPGFGFQQLLPEIARIHDNPPTLAYLTPGPDSTVLKPYTVLMRSTDDGKTWQQHNWPTPIVSPSLATDGQGHLIVHGYAPAKLFGLPPNPVYWSADGGATWNRSSTQNFGRMNLFYTKSGKIIAYNSTQRDYGQTLVFYSLDHGHSFIQSKDPDLDSTGIIKAIESDKKGRTIAVTEYGYLLVTDDDGASWRIAKKVNHHYLYAISSRLQFYENGVALALMVGGRIVRSTDRGDTWRTVQSPLPEGYYEFTALCADDTGRLFATGHGMAIRSLDYGATWKPVRLE